MTPAIAIVGMACHYPDARSPTDLWENVLAQRRAFRSLPAERLRLEDYLSPDRTAPDHTYSGHAALIEGYGFDRVSFRVVGSTFRSADLAHWLALDVAARALHDAGFPEGKGLPRETTGVLLGNTLTGEFSRANSLRLRWPYVRRVVEAALADEAWSPNRRQTFLDRLETAYKAPFPPVGEETLAGNLSNTIAGRVCNYFDLKGGGYTVDGACASSLLAVATACSALTAGDLDIALAGGVDLSLDPFELVGFAKTGALAPVEMRVYDNRSAGFWPGEGCGFVVLMRHEDALDDHRHVYAVIRGWGVSSDGSGGITRPEAEGQILAVNRAYRRAGFSVATVGYFEGHGTGTALGDATELHVLSQALRAADATSTPAAIGSIKANIGHTKAAAGVAGLIKTTMALHDQLLPPTTGCEEPHTELIGPQPALRVLREGEVWPENKPLRAAVSGMGFGGINAHVVLEGTPRERRTALTERDRVLLSSAQDTELFLLRAADTVDMLRQIDQLLSFAGALSLAELTDLAAHLETVASKGPLRAAFVASTPSELAKALDAARDCLTQGVSWRVDLRRGVYLGSDGSLPRIGFLFPGQGAPAHLDGGALRRRFDFIDDLYRRADLPAEGDGIATEVAQPAIATASLGALAALYHLGIEGSVAVGHSLGEITAISWAGALDEEALLHVTHARGRVMAALPGPTGTMAAIKAAAQDVARLLNSDAVVIAGLNSPQQTVISGEASAVNKVLARAQEKGLGGRLLSVSHAFHSPLVAAAAATLAAHLSGVRFRPLERRVISTVTGTPLEPHDDLRALLRRQVTEPVRFWEAVAATMGNVDLFIEAGPGTTLTGLVERYVDVPVVPIDAGGSRLSGLLQAAASAFALGAPIQHHRLFAGRFTRPFSLDWHPIFLTNPCELAPVPCSLPRLEPNVTLEREATDIPPEQGGTSAGEPPLALIHRLVADRAELPPDAVHDDSRLLSDLHLNSIAVAELVSEAARRLGLPPPAAPTDFADSTVHAIALALEEWARNTADTVVEASEMPPGVDSWIRPFSVELVERALLPGEKPRGSGTWQIVAPPDHPLVNSLPDACAGWGGGVIVCLPPEPDKRHVGLLLRGAHAALADRKNARFVLVQQGGGAASFARTLHLEAPDLTVCVVDIPMDHPFAVEWLAAEVKAAHGYAEAYYDVSGKRREPVLHLLPTPEPTNSPLRPGDVLLVTGGGKGIAAECALALAREMGLRLALIGRSEPADDAELSANLERFAASRIAFRYTVADVTDAAAVHAAIADLEQELGSIVGVLHGAGTNVPTPVSALDEDALLRTLAPKIDGLRNVLAALDAESLRLLVTFGSIIARAGMQGEADYALANEWLSAQTARFQQVYSSCRCICVEWSVWSGVGMGERLGRVDALVRRGITPLSPDAGISFLCRMVRCAWPTSSIVVTGRFPAVRTLRVEEPDLPFLRFLERPRVFYPGVELVVDAELTLESDPYLDDHVFEGQRLLPAVMGLEAMAQAAIAVSDNTEPPQFENVAFMRPVVMPEAGSLTLRLAALVREDSRVDVVLRTDRTAFQVDHFRATCRFGAVRSDTELQPAAIPEGDGVPIDLDPARDLYGQLLFQRGRFSRLRCYHHLWATECLAEITEAPSGSPDWFGRYLPLALVLGDAGTRDATIHAIQACIPHARLLPIGIDRLTVDATQACGPRYVSARERLREGNVFHYDVVLLDESGQVRERWDGLRLQMVESRAISEPWPGVLLGPYLERRLAELVPGADLRVAAALNGDVEVPGPTDTMIQRAVGTVTSVVRRPDGKPELGGDAIGVSAAHAGALSLTVAGRAPISCDVEPVAHRQSSMWSDLLGIERFRLAGVLAAETSDDLATAATCVWAAHECLKKGGQMLGAPLVLRAVEPDGWILLASGPCTIATFVTRVRAVPSELAIAVLVGHGAQSLTIPPHEGARRETDVLAGC